MVCNICGHRFRIGDDLIVHYLDKHPGLVWAFPDVRIAYGNLVKAIFPYYNELFDDYTNWEQHLK